MPPENRTLTVEDIFETTNDLLNPQLGIGADIFNAITGRKTTVTFNTPNLIRDTSSPNSNASFLSYPENIQGNFDYLKISITKFVPISQATSLNSSNTNIANTNNNQQISLFDRFRIAAERTTLSTLSPTTFSASAYLGFFDNVPTNNNNNTQTARTPTSALGNIQTLNSNEVVANIALPVPDTVLFSDGLSFSNSGGGAVGKLAPRLLNSSEASKTVGKLANVAADQLLTKVLDRFSAIVGSSEQFTQGLTGQILNPYIEQVFRGVEPREFIFNWNLVPRNVSEQNTIRELIKTLRKFAHPDYSANLNGNNITQLNEFEQRFNDLTGGGFTDRWLTVPFIFRLAFNHYDGSVISYLPKFKPCVCTAITVNYTPDNAWIYHQTENGETPSHASVAIKIGMSFKETEIISKGDVEGGF